MNIDIYKSISHGFFTDKVFNLPDGYIVVTFGEPGYCIELYHIGIIWNDIKDNKNGIIDYILTNIKNGNKYINYTINENGSVINIRTYIYNSGDIVPNMILKYEKPIKSIEEKEKEYKISSYEDRNGIYAWDIGNTFELR